MSDLAFLDVKGRVARTLLELTKQPDAMTHPDGMQIKGAVAAETYAAVVERADSWGSKDLAVSAT